MTVRITKELDGKEVLYLLRHTLGLSSAMIRHLKFLEDGIMINGERVTVRRVMRDGDELYLNTADEEQEKPVLAVDLPLSIAYEDDDVVIPDKPAFMPTHPSHDHYEDTVANALAFRYKEEQESFVFRPVNRLDRNTSGLLIIAKNRIAAAKLTRAMQEKRMRKVYTCTSHINQRALAFYKSLGFEEEGLLKSHFFEGIDEIQLAKFYTYND